MIQDSGSNYQFYNHTEKANPSKSVFDLSSLVTTTINNGGTIVPLKWFETIPGDKFEINFQALLRVMPQEVPLYSRQRMFIHAYYSRLEELWNEAQTYMTKGYTGRENLTKPTISSDNFDETLWNGGNGTVGVESLAQYLGLPLGAKYSDLAESGVTCLPFMMYERIYRDYYMNGRHVTPLASNSLYFAPSGSPRYCARLSVSTVPFPLFHSVASKLSLDITGFFRLSFPV